MKKILSLILCVCIMIPLFSLYTFAEGESNNGSDTSEHTNIAPEAIPNVFSNYYAYSKAPFLNDNIIDGQINSNGAYEFWRPQTPQRDPSVAGTDPWFTLKFTEYKEISKISLLVELAYSTECIVKYEALIQGEWIEIGTAKYSASPVYGGFSRVHEVSVTVAEPVTTKQIRGTVSGYINWDPPMISECFVMGATGEAPEFDVPEGAYLTTNVVLSGYGEASSSKLNNYPALANDDSNLTFWRAKSNANGQWYKVEFDQPYSVNKIGVDLSAIKLVEDENNEINEAYTFNVKVELLVNGAWTTVHTGELTSSEGSDGLFTKNLDSAVTASAIKITYLETNGNTPVLSELSAITSDGTKCMYIGDIISLHQKLSTAGGNLACYGTPYASSTFTYSNMSDASFINDGMIDKDAGIWVAETSACPTYCGVQLKDKMTVDTVVLYFNDNFGVDKDGDNHVSSFDIQYKNSSGSYVTVASGTSLDLTTGQPIVAIKFNPVVTDDIRVVFKTNGGTLPYLKELEVYSHNSNGDVFVYSQFVGLPTEREIPSITESFAEYTVAKRPKLFKKYILAMVNASPITHPLKSGVNRWINIG
ncbi:MAG: discoidin domain-containing protein [Clostridia bacterium]|nr:discoidin domain-containing protein [Clostridia bacterium]